MTRKTFFLIYGYIHHRTSASMGWDDVEKIQKVKRLANRHHALAEMDCNGVGWIRGVPYYNGTIDNWARQEHGARVKSAYIGEDETIFDVESEKVTKKIDALVATLPGKWQAVYQGDPRGATVRLILDGNDITSMFDL